ncbi:MAG TPA: hypothetical protein PKZ25_10800 [Candidatus Hydrogenedentes bacterium]|nr:hypothetical protein [Candidatus Hydrogenedentota bacterium]
MKRALFLVLAITSLLAACGAPTATPPTTPALTPTPPQSSDMNLLLLGTDKRSASAADWRTDTLIVVAMHHRFGAACILAGVIARVGVDRFLRHTPRWHETLQLAATRGYALGTAVAVTLAALLVQQGRDQAWLPRTPFEQNVAMYLSNRGQPDTMIVTRPDQYAMQARLGHPVMANLALPTWPLGRPSLGPPIAKLYREIYGIHFGNGRPARQNWATVWRNRSREEWQDLAAAHGFRYVLAPNHVAVRLPAVLIGETESLYEAWANGSP